MLLTFSFASIMSRFKYLWGGTFKTLIDSFGADQIYYFLRTNIIQNTNEKLNPTYWMANSVRFRYQNWLLFIEWVIIY